jgi:PhnB protein
MQLPSGHQTVMPYFIARSPETLISFACDVFKAKVTQQHLRDDGNIMHAEILIGDSTLMIGGATKDWPARTCDLFIYVDNADECFQKAVKLGAEVVMEIAEKDYGRSGGVKDTNGNIWWITSLPE